MSDSFDNISNTSDHSDNAFDRISDNTSDHVFGDNTSDNVEEFFDSTVIKFN